jgi:hypothetical protein
LAGEKRAKQGQNGGGRFVSPLEHNIHQKVSVFHQANHIMWIVPLLVARQSARAYDVALSQYPLDPVLDYIAGNTPWEFSYNPAFLPGGK